MGSARRRPDGEPNPWQAGTLEWATTSPPAAYNFQATPAVAGREPLWDERAELLDPAADPAAEPAATGPDDERLNRETLATSLIDTRPLHVLVLPSDTLKPLVVAIGLAWAGFGIVLDLWPIVVAAALVALGGVAAWMWPDRELLEPAAPGRSLGRRDLPHRVHGPRSVPWWGLVLGLLVVGLVVFNLVLSYVFLAVMAPEWPPAGVQRASLDVPLLGLGLLLAASGPMWAAQWGVRRGELGALLAALLGVAGVVGGLAVLVMAAHLFFAAPDPTASSFGAITAVLYGAQVVLGGVAVGVSAALAVQAARGSVTRDRYMAVDHAAVIWYFVGAAWLVIFVVLHGQPWL